MCIIAIKPKNKEIQSKEILKTCFQRNYDGAGYMFVNNNEVIIKKGYMDFDKYYVDLMNDYKKYNLKNKNLVMHFRIGTSGQSKLGCTHPFPLTNNFEQLELTRNKTNIGVCHNGIVSMFNSRLAKYSDTELYIANVLTPIVKLNLNAYKFKDIQNLIKETTTSKWVFLDKFDEVYRVGDFVEDNGYIYSNTTYKPYTPPKYDYNYNDTYYYDYSWYTKALTTNKTIEKPKYLNELYEGNIIMGDEIEYLEVEKDNEYFFDSNFNIYKRHKSGYAKVDSNAIIYTNETFSVRRDFEKSE